MIISGKVKQFPCTVMSCHGRNSGSEALFLTPECIKDAFDDENASLEYELGDVLFGFEPKGKPESPKEFKSRE